jgi:MFS family permease
MAKAARRPTAGALTEARNAFRPSLSYSPAVARDRHLRALAGAIAISAIGDWVAVIALGFRANDAWDGGVALLLICLWSPIALLAGHVGILVDRLETRSLAVAAGVFQAVVAGALAFVSSLPLILVLAFVLGIGVAVSSAAEFALVPLLAGSRTVGRANGLVESARGIGFVAGPALAGIVAGSAGTKYAMLADAATFLLIAGVLALLPVRRRVVHTHDAKPAARDGIRLLFGERVLAITLGTGAIGLVFMSASIPGDFAYATHTLGVGKLAFGFVLTAWAIGMIVASNTLFARIPAGAVAAATLVGAAVQGLAKFVAPFWQLYVVMLVAWSIGGMGHGIKNTGYRTLIHHRVDAAQHGRAFAAYNGLRNTAELAALAGGAVLVSTIGGRGTLWVAGGVSAAAAIVGVVALGSRRDQPETAAANAS